MSSNYKIIPRLFCLYHYDDFNLVNEEERKRMYKQSSFEMFDCVLAMRTNL
jgi:hypothetical protein